ncbi:MAG: benzoyl-CoA reductase, bzd-type, subunit Q [Rhodocyclaceae bacterium]|jgi:benzoyl-CoA reductase subunit A|uniref:Benzoyl-CoA reductase, bzd-type, subunit Q n=1 Tax=Candidatus Desulfobacillus denitrificans TaxID=2608985 RepID=A0A809QZX2_9PROT|nr:benzoyl-CoA reductase, bzd-type, subunit Q [Zoogloeaceae bacterium]MBP9653945.1 benzoyl-CoA reductase, bzd-type, subunit Q [Rhodocyclaceae bacterium]MCZ2174512.1 benzoyl-CoA reductase, bzd-type, subunit Q [Burkholderiales bacterium]BBO20929.1 benzoyl-CoA reductase, bzd-type, subunit Q [Candidatus Desulfobacillus denitrificans]GIK46094.1 MAG: 2-hydroxyglutaryl-CoA dehydratase [Betaproteobacteria bacterium]
MADTAGEKKEYWRWQESCWIDESKDWRAAKIVTAGIDVGSVSSQAVVCVDGELYGFNSMRTGNNSPDSARNAIQGVLDKSGMKLEDIKYVVGTGYGRVNVPFAHKAITEIACHARGANYMGGNAVRTILDMGGQDCKAIHCDEKGKVTNFLMNDKCAAGTGRGMEVISDLMQIPIAELGQRSFDVDEEPNAVSSVCVVFAKSEALGLLKAGYTKNKVIAAYCQAMAERVVSLLERIGVEKEFFITGGIAKNPGVVKRIEKILGIQAVQTKIDSQIAGALGAALFGYTLMQKQGASAKAA